MEIAAQISAVVGVLLLVSGLVWLYVSAAQGKYNFLYVVEFTLMLPIFLVRHWHEVKAQGVVTLVGLILVIAGYSHGW